MEGLAQPPLDCVWAAPRCVQPASGGARIGVAPAKDRSGDASWAFPLLCARWALALVTARAEASSLLDACALFSLRLERNPAVPSLAPSAHAVSLVCPPQLDVVIMAPHYWGVPREYQLTREHRQTGPVMLRDACFEIEARKCARQVDVRL